MTMQRQKSEGQGGQLFLLDSGSIEINLFLSDYATQIDMAGFLHFTLSPINYIRRVSMKKQRPDVVTGNTIQMKTGCGNIYITLNCQGDRPFEVFLNMGKAGGCAFAQCESIGRLISYSLRIGGEVREIVKELKGIRCHQTTDDCMSCADAVAQVLESPVYAIKEQNEFKQTLDYERIGQ